MADRSVVVALRSMGIAQYATEVATASRETLRYDDALMRAGKAADNYSRAVARAGAGSAQAAAAQARYTTSLKRVAIAEEDVWLAAERTEAKQLAAAEAVTAAKEREAAAAQAAADREVAAAGRAAAAQTAAAEKQLVATKKIGTAFGVAGTGAAIALGLAAKAASDFQSKMAMVESISHASAGQMSRLADASKNYANIGISASGAADAEIELVKAGIGVQQQLGGALTGTLNLAAAGQMNVADATQIAAVAMTQFKLKAGDIPHLADLLAAGADKALGSVQDLGYGLSQAGLPAHQLGVSVEETVSTLAEFAQAGLIGERGGTVLKQMFLKLQAPSAAAAAIMDKYNLSLYDAQGNFVGMSNLAGQLQRNLSGLTLQEREHALAVIFGSRAIQGANVLYQDGQAGVEAWTRKVDDSGFAARQAQAKMDSLAGDLDKLRATATNDAIAFGEQLQPALRGVAQEATGLLSAAGSLPDWLKQLGGNATIAIAAVGLGVFAMSRLKWAAAQAGKTLGVLSAEQVAAGASAATMAEGEVAAGTATQSLGLKATLTANKVALLRGAAGIAAIGLATLNENVKGDAASGLLDIATGAAAGTAILPGWGTLIGAGAGALLTLTNTSAGASTNVDGFTESLDKNTGAITRNTRALSVRVASHFEGILDQAGVSTDTFTRALLGNASAAKEAKDGLAGAGIGGELLIKMLDKVTSEAEKTRAELEKGWITEGKLGSRHAALADSTRHMGEAVSDLAGDTKRAGGEVAQFGEDAVQARGGVDGLGHSMSDLAKAAYTAWQDMTKADSAVLTQRGDYRAYQQAVDDAAAALKKNGKTLDANTQKGRDNAATLDTMASTASAYISTITDPRIQLTKLQESRHQLLQTAESFGMTDKAAWAYVNRVLGIPPAVRTAAEFETNKALSSIKGYKDTINSVPGFKNTVVTAKTQSAIADLMRVIGLLGEIHSKDVWINVNQNFTHSGAQAYPSAKGNLFEAYAGGGIRTEQHVAQFAPAGAMRVWAEPETGGELYVPLANDWRRPRARKLLAEGAHRLGGEARFGNDVVMGGGGRRYASDVDTQRQVIQVQTQFTGPLKVAGKLSFDEDGNAYIRGIAHAEVQGEALHNATLGRMKR